MESVHGRQNHLRRQLNNCVLQGGGEQNIETILKQYRPSHEALTSKGLDRILERRLDTYDEIKDRR